jgi:MFS family permease
MLNQTFLVRNILALSVVSLLADLSTEMMQPILPLFLVGTLGASYSFVGLIEGSSDSVSSLVKVVSGWYSDRFAKRKPFVVLGYLPTAILKPLLYFAQTPLQVLGIRIPERAGKGFRGAPRDALIAESVDKKDLGKAFGFHRASDTIGAVIGSFLGFVFLTIISGGGANFPNVYKIIFLISAIPAAISVIIAQFFVSEKVKSSSPQTIITNHEEHEQWKKKEKTSTTQKISFLKAIQTFDARLKLFIIVSSIFAFANFNLSFFILRAKVTGVSDTNILLLYTLFNVMYAGVSYPFGAISDKIGRDKVVMIGFAVFVIAALGFAFFSTSLVNVVILFAILGIYMGIFDGSQKSYISEIANPSYKATALGTVATLTGIITLPASLVAGILWDKFGPTTTFIFSAVTASIALVIFIIIKHRI